MIRVPSRLRSSGGSPAGSSASLPRRAPFRGVLAAGIVLLLMGSATAGSFVNFESGHVRPLALSGDLLFAVNTPDNRLSIFRRGGVQGLTLAAEVPVGLEPVAVAVASTNEVWVVNHLSDSVSIVHVNPSAPKLSYVERTLLLCDEPSDIVFAGPNKQRAFITTARRGRHCPLPALLTTPGVPRGLVQVYDRTNLGSAFGGTPIAMLELLGDSPRALAASADGRVVYAAILLSGNRRRRSPGRSWTRTEACRRHRSARRTRPILPSRAA